MRFLRNERENSNHFVSLKLRGVRSNRDAVGAVVELTVAGRRRVRQVSAGEGYLAQASSTIHFGLGDASSIEKLVVRWPGGDVESIDTIAIDGHYEVLEGSGRATRLEIAPVTLPGPATRANETTPPPPSRLSLKTPLPLPPTLLRGLGVPPGEVTVVNLWAHWCKPCAEELEAWLMQSDDLDTRSIRWSPLSLDRATDREAAAEWFRSRHANAGTGESPQPVFATDGTLRTLEVLLEHVTGRPGELPIPANLLIDGRGNLQMMSFGAALPARFLSDAETVLDPSVLPARRSLHPGRWYYRSRRNYDELARRLAASERATEAAFYQALTRRE